MIRFLSIIRFQVFHLFYDWYKSYLLAWASLSWPGFSSIPLYCENWLLSCHVVSSYVQNVNRWCVSDLAKTPETSDVPALNTWWFLLMLFLLSSLSSFILPSIPKWDEIPLLSYITSCQVDSPLNEKLILWLPRVDSRFVESRFAESTVFS